MEDEGIITYDKLYEVLRLEKYKKELQKIDSGFYSKVINYLSEKKAIIKSQENKDSIFAEQSIAKTRRQLENTNMIIKEMYERRESKIVQLALFNSRTGEKLQETDALLDEEIMFYNSMVSLFNLYRKGMLLNILDGKLPEIKDEKIMHEELPKENINKFIRFLHPVPKFVGEDLKTYGPFDIEDVANLPQKVSEILIKNNRAEEI